MEKILDKLITHMFSEGCAACFIVGTIATMIVALTLICKLLGH